MNIHLGADLVDLGGIVRNSRHWETLGGLTVNCGTVSRWQ